MSEFLSATSDELIDQHGRSMRPYVVKWNGRLWLKKPNGRWPEILGYQLAGSWLNIPETISGWRAREAIDLTGTIVPMTEEPLIRIGQTLAHEELPVGDLDQAIAGELAYSVWIRRRDPSAWNRVYLDGVPVFFDHHIAFGNEADHRPLAGFLAPGHGGGYASQWRLRELRQDEVPTTTSERALPLHIAVQRVRSRAAFDRHLDDAVRRILAVTDPELEKVVNASGAPTIVALRLAHWRDELPQAMEQLRPILEQPE